MGFFQELRLSRRPAAGLIAIGLFWGSFAAWLPEIKLRSGVSDAEFGALMMMSAVGGMITMASAPRLQVRFGRGLMARSAMGVAVIALIPALVGSAWGLGLALLLIGAVMSLCDILANIRISDIEARVGRSLMNLNHGLFSLALATSAAVMGLLRTLGVAHGVAVALVAAAVFGCALLARGGNPVAPDAADAEPESGPVVPAPWLLILPGAAILWLSFMAENGTESWAAIHIERTLGAAGGIGAFGPAMFALSMGIARLGGQALSRVLGEVRLLAISIGVALVGAIALALAPGLLVAVIGAAGLGLGVAVVVPTGNSLLSRTVPAPQRASAIARAWTIGFTGFFVGPPVLGLVSEYVGLRGAFLLIAAIVALMLPCLWLMARRLRY